MAPSSPERTACSGQGFWPYRTEPVAEGWHAGFCDPGGQATFFLDWLIAAWCRGA